MEEDPEVIPHPLGTPQTICPELESMFSDLAWLQTFVLHTTTPLLYLLGLDHNPEYTVKDFHERNLPSPIATNPIDI